MCSITNIIKKYSILYNIEYRLLSHYFNSLINNLKCCSDICETSCNFDKRFYTTISKEKIHNIHAELNTCEKETILSLVC